MKICAFDFDGTLIKKDSIKLFCKWVCVNKIEFFLIYHLYFRMITMLNNQNLKFIRVNYFYNLMIKRKLDINNLTKKLLKEEFLDSQTLINDMKKKYHVIIISASYDFILQGYSDYYNIPVFANSLSNLFDLNYKNKVEVIKSNYEKNDILEIAFGNSEGDYEMLNYAKRPYFRNTKGEIIEWQI